MLNKEQLVAEGIKILSNRRFYQYNDTRTWQGYFDKFQVLPAEKNNQLLKVIWATYISRSKPNYQIKEDQIVQLARMCPDTCPVEGTPLDYGIAYNSMINPNNPGQRHHTFFQPSIDHRIPKSHFKKYSGTLDGDPDDISNYVIVSNEANRIKNSRFTTEEDLLNYCKGIKETYFK